MSLCSLKYRLKADLLRWMNQLQGKIHCDLEMGSRNNKVLQIRRFSAPGFSEGTRNPFVGFAFPKHYDLTGLVSSSFQSYDFTSNFDRFSDALCASALNCHYVFILS